jgi:hypothetical protein
MILRRLFLQQAAVVAYFALVIAGVPTLGFSQTIDQQNVGRVAIHYADLNKVGDDFQLLQSFTAGITGILDKVALPIYEDVIVPPDNKDEWYNSSVTVTILNRRLGKLAVLGSTVIPAASIPTTLSYDAKQNALDVNPVFRLSVTRGGLYYIAVQANKIVPTDYAGNGLSWFGTVADYPKGGPYGSYNGSLFPFFYNNYDLEFRTYVVPTRESIQTFFAPTRASDVPEPSTWALMLVGFAGLAYAGYRASRKSASAESTTFASSAAFQAAPRRSAKSLRQDFGAPTKRTAAHSAMVPLR